MCVVFFVDRPVTSWRAPLTLSTPTWQAWRGAATAGTEWPRLPRHLALGPQTTHLLLPQGRHFPQSPIQVWSLTHYFCCSKLIDRFWTLEGLMEVTFDGPRSVLERRFWNYRETLKVLFPRYHLKNYAEEYLCYWSYLLIQRTRATRPKPTAGSEPQTLGTARRLSKLQLPKRRKRWEHFTKKCLSRRIRVF